MGAHLFSMLISLITSRVTLEAPGVNNYVINSAVTGVIAMFSVVSGSLSDSISLVRRRGRFSFASAAKSSALESFPSNIIYLKLDYSCKSNQRKSLISISKQIE